MCDQLTEEDVNDILYVSAPSNRKRKAGCDLTPRYQNKQRKTASDLAKQWGESGVPQIVYTKLITSKPGLLEKFGWEVEALTNKEENYEVEMEPTQVSPMNIFSRYINATILF